MSKPNRTKPPAAIPTIDPVLSALLGTAELVAVELEIPATVPETDRWVAATPAGSVLATLLGVVTGGTEAAVTGATLATDFVGVMTVEGWTTETTELEAAPADVTGLFATAGLDGVFTT